MSYVPGADYLTRIQLEPSSSISRLVKWFKLVMVLILL